MNAADKTFREAVAALNSGNISDAEKLFLKVIRNEPSHIGALNLLTIVLIKRQQFADAEKYIERAVKLNQNSDVSYYNYGLICKNLGKQEKALEQFSRALQINEAVPETWNNRGTVLNDLKRYDEAIRDFDRALSLNENYADALSNKARSLDELQRDDDALESYKRALALRPDLVNAWIGIGNIFWKLKRHEEALAAYDHATALRPDLTEAWLGRGGPLLMTRRYDDALATYDKAISLKPDLENAWVGRGNVLWRLNRFDEALSAYDKADSIKPDMVEVWYGRANVFADLRQYDRSLSALDRALELKPDLAEAWSSRAHVFALLKRNEDALAANREALKLDDTLVQAHFNKGLMHLLMGQYEEGWLECEWRNKFQLSAGARRLTKPLWLGSENIDGKTILLHSEQGLGDTLQFCRYVHLVAELGATVILEVQKPLLGLLKSLAGVTELIEAGKTLPEFDYHTPLMSLPLAFKTTLANIPTDIPYLAADRESILRWSERLGPKSKTRVGLVWSGGFRPDQPELWTTNERRNLPLNKLAPLGYIDCQFYSLQKGEPAETEFANVNRSDWGGPKIIDLTSSMTGFSDTAAFVANLDLVISVDTATAHLVAAMDKPLWLLNRFDIDWRWANNSAWYPKASIYIQPAPGDWDRVIQQVALDLTKLVE